MTNELFNKARILNDEIRELSKTICLLKKIPTKVFSIHAASIGGGVDHACSFHLDGDLLIAFLKEELKKREQKFAKL